MPAVSISPQPKLQFFDAGGAPLSGGKLYTYAAGTTTPLASYTDSTGNVVNTNPVVLDSRGEASVWLAGAQYKLALYTASNVLIWTVDGVGGPDQVTLATLAASGGSALVGFLQAGTGAVVRSAQAKMRDVVSVLDFGAVGDGVTDDTVAIQTAFTYIKSRGGQLLFPKPSVRYLITDTIGTNQLSASDFADNVELFFEPGAEVRYAPAGSPPFGTAAIVLEGNNVAIRGGLILTSSKSINWQSNPTPQRTPYYSGIIVGGKGNRRLPENAAYDRAGAVVEGATVRNFNAPITAYAASDVMIRDNTVEYFTDTGILIDNCLSNIEVCHNRVRYGFDDCFFARHYYNSPWILEYIGDLWVHHNQLTDTFAKSAGFGGYADVNCHDNFCKNTWYAAINIEIDAPNTWLDNSKRIKIHDNIIIDAARNFDPTNANLPAAQQAQVSDTTQAAGVLFTTAASGYPANTFENISVQGNLIVNPAVHGISASHARIVSLHTNHCVPGRTTKNGVNYDTSGASVRLEECQNVDVTSNKFASDGTYSWVRCYDIIGGTYTQKIRVGDNPIEDFSSALWTISNSTVETTQFSYSGYALNASAAWSPGGFATGTTNTFDLSVSLARLGDYVQAAHSNDSGGLVIFGWVQSSGVVRVAFSNLTGGTVSLGSGTVKAIVQRRN